MVNASAVRVLPALGCFLVSQRPMKPSRIRLMGGSIRALTIFFEQKYVRGRVKRGLSGLVIVLFSLVSDCENGDGLISFNLKQRDISRGPETDDQRS